MSSPPDTNGTNWGSSFRLTATEKWRARSAAMGADVTRALVEYSRPLPGMQVLDLASGTGEPAISLASLVGPDGHVTALDLSTDLLKIAQRRARQRGLENFAAHQADAHLLPFRDDSFDLITSRFGVMFLGGEALVEALRVLKPGARACFAAWGPFEQPYWSSTMGIVHRHVGGAIVPTNQDPFRYSQAGSLSAALREAGFLAVEETTRTLPWTWNGSAEDVWEYAKTVAAPFRPMLERVPEEKWPAIDEEVHSAVRKFGDGDGIRFGAAIVLASGKK
jgi:ubiquinone/menaquinone biosynthesis C-methylase UbiE